MPKFNPIKMLEAAGINNFRADYKTKKVFLVSADILRLLGISGGICIINTYHLTDLQRFVTGAGRLSRFLI
jgi:hypothetical protein